jgi:hypothetical protein
MPAFFPAGPPPDDGLEVVEDLWDVPPEPVDWDEVETEARRQGCTVADILYDRAGRDRD